MSRSYSFKVELTRQGIAKVTANNEREARQLVQRYFKEGFNESFFADALTISLNRYSRVRLIKIVPKGRQQKDGIPEQH